MAPCPSCGHENPEEASFCSACGTPLSATEIAREQRKVVSVVFCDLVGSTALGESTDPEALRARMRRYFEDLRAIVERHGGVVEKFVGDAVMAVFGIPVSHEDDALRAVRAASEMRAAIAEHGLEARIGVNTGEVVVGGQGETLVTGDAVNVAARLEQAAASGEALIGAETHLLVRDAVQVEPVEPLALKGKSDPVEAFRLLEVVAGAPSLARHFETPLVGRGRERQRLWRDYEDTIADRTCRLFTLLGPAGIGKSRLVADFLERVERAADVLRGRCLPYGEGITYWPLVEMLIAIGVEPDSVIGTSPPETQLAFRRLLEARAAERAQVLVVDDLQWAEPVFIDLVEHIADLSRDAPIFLLCVARTELLDVRSGWGGGKLNTTSLLLEPLGVDECDELMERLVGGAALDAPLRERIMTASAGNPLFVEEMLAMVRERRGDREIAVPPTIHALLQARIDSLDGDVRGVMERGAVEGEVFHRGAVAELSPDLLPPAVESHLATLIRKEFIRATSPTFPEDEGFRFRHLLIRDAAYESLPKATRAELHERFANWLSTHDLVEGDELVGYHLEQAHRYRAELDGSDAALDGLARRASTYLAAAGRGALERGDFNAGRSLFGRATSLLPEDDEARLAFAPDFADALLESNSDEAWKVLSAARRAGVPGTRAHAAVSMATMRLGRGHASSFEDAESWRNEALAVFEESGDEYGLGRYWWSVAMESFWVRLRVQETVEAGERALAHLERAGEKGARLRGTLRSRLGSCYYNGPMPVDEALERIQALGTREHGLLEEAWSSADLGRLHAMKGEVELARELWSDGRQVYVDAGLLLSAASFAQGGAQIAFRAGDLHSEEALLRDSLEILEGIGERAFYSTQALQLAECLYRAGADVREIEALCAKARETTPAEDLVNFVWLDMVSGLLHARRGEYEQAEEYSRRAVALTETTDFHFARSYPRAYLAEVLALSSRDEEAVGVAAEAFEIFEAKGDVTAAAQFRSRLSSLGVEVV
jgi:class 3 adenylate cyclase/tetratricopeptide (TPR) repeat protein